MRLIVGLGNKGKEYDNTRHNVGFAAIDKIVESLGLSFAKNKFDGLYVETSFNNEKVIFLKPQKYMNLSGEVIKKFCDFFRIEIDNILIIHDDMDIPIGKIKIKLKGSSGGHNGLKNIEENLKTKEYKRIKIGISRNNNIDIVNYVLGKFSGDEKKVIDEVINSFPQIFEDYMNLSFENLMNKYNSSK